MAVSVIKLPLWQKLRHTAQSAAPDLDWQRPQTFCTIHKTFELLDVYTYL